MPLTERLERAFAARVSDLPDATRLVLLVAALDDEDAIDEILQAGSAIAATSLDFEVAAPAAEAGIIDLDLQRLRFRHPLIRSAVAQSAGVGERWRVHEALANVLLDHPDRRAWHRAALLSGEHEDVALELEEAGARARQRGAIAVAVTALRRAAELSDRAGRSRRLLAAAGLAVELGRPDVVVPLLREVNQLDLGELERVGVTWIEETRRRRITEAGRHDRVASLVYITAFAPDAGESVNALIADPPPGAPVRPILPPQEGFLFLDFDKFADSFAADVPATLAAFMADSQVPWGVEALNGTVSDPAWRSKPSWYLIATEDRMIPPPAQRQMAERAGAMTTEASGSHAI